MPFSPRVLLPRALSLLLLGAGAAVLMADSANCPDGYSGTKLNAAFVSTCPTSFGPQRGTLHLELAGGDYEDNAGLLRDLRASGFQADSATLSSNGSDTCSLASFQFAGGAAWDEVHCERIDLNAPHQEVSCTTTVRSPLVLQLGRPTQRGDVDAATVDDAGDAADVSLPPHPGGSSGGDLPPSSLLLTPGTCTITLDRIAQ